MISYIKRCMINGLIMVQLYSVVYDKCSCGGHIMTNYDEMCDYITNCTMNGPVKVKIYSR